MASAVIGALRVNLSVDTAAFDKGLKDVNTRLAGIGKQMRNVGTVLTAAVTAPLVAMGKKSLDAFKEQEKALALVESGLRATGGTVGFTTDELSRMASELQKVSTFGDEDILKNVTASLLKFQSVTGDTFTRAQTAILDFAAQTGTSLEGASQQIGRALEDPISGLTLLRRAGIVFTEQQTEMIKQMHAAGDAAGAQGLILDALEGKFKGAAAAMAETTDGKFAQAWNAVSDAMEAVGVVVAEAVVPLANGIKLAAEAFSGLSPQTQRFIVIVGALAAALGPLIATLGLVVIGISALSAPVLAVIGVVAALTAAAVAFGPELMAMKDTALAAVQALYEGIASWLGDKLGPVWSGLTGAIEKVQGSFQWLYDTVVGNSIIPDMVMGVEHWMTRLSTGLSDQWAKTAADLAGHFETIAKSFASHSGFMAKAGKAFAIVRALINAYQAASNALATAPWPLNFAAAAAALASGLGHVASIRSQKVPSFASGGSFMVGGKSGIDQNRVMMDVSRGERVTIETPEQQRGNGQIETIRLVSDLDSVYTFDHIRKLVRRLNEYGRDNGMPRLELVSA